jgi:hypothetical protein
MRFLILALALIVWAGESKANTAAEVCDSVVLYRLHANLDELAAVSGYKAAGQKVESPFKLPAQRDFAQAEFEANYKQRIATEFLVANGCEEAGFIKKGAKR